MGGSGAKPSEVFWQVYSCLHLQVAVGTVTNEDLPEGLRNSMFGEPLLASDGSAMGDDEFESAEL